MQEFSSIIKHNELQESLMASLCVKPMSVVGFCNEKICCSGYHVAIGQGPVSEGSFTGLMSTFDANIVEANMLIY